MTNKQSLFIDEAVKCMQNARKWLDQAMYYSGEQMPDDDIKKVRQAYDKICEARDML